MAFAPVTVQNMPALAEELVPSVITSKPARHGSSEHLGFSAFGPRWATILRLVPFYTDLT
jgi:hypothetical protein